MHYPKEKPTFRVFTANFRVSEFLGILRYADISYRCKFWDELKTFNCRHHSQWNSNYNTEFNDLRKKYLFEMSLTFQKHWYAWWKTQEHGMLLQKWNECTVQLPYQLGPSNLYQKFPSYEVTRPSKYDRFSCYDNTVVMSFRFCNDNRCMPCSWGFHHA